MGDRSIKTMKNKKSLKNLKQFRVRSKFMFYVLFRPIAQKWFFPIFGLILLAGVLHHEATKEYVFENPKVAVVFDESIAEGEAQSKSVGNDRNDTVADQPQKQTLESSASTHSTPVRASGVIEAIQEVASKEGIDWKILYGICKKESNCNPDRVGDNGNSYGAFQIHQKYHPGTIECAKDLKCSAEWTAKRLKRHAGLGEWKMIQSHNGLLANNANAYYVEDVYEIIENL